MADLSNVQLCKAGPKTGELCPGEHPRAGMLRGLSYGDSGRSFKARFGALIGTDVYATVANTDVF